MKFGLITEHMLFYILYNLPCNAKVERGFIASPNGWARGAVHIRCENFWGGDVIIYALLGQGIFKYIQKKSAPLPKILQTSAFQGPNGIGEQLLIDIGEERLDLIQVVWEVQNADQLQSLGNTRNCDAGVGGWAITHYGAAT